MKTQEEYFDDIKEIRGMMEKSTRFLSLSGLSGIMAGIYALTCAAVVYLSVYTDDGDLIREVRDTTENRIFLITSGLVTLIFTLLTGFVLTARKAKEKSQHVFDKLSLRLMGALMIPLTTGGLVILILLKYWFIGFVAPFTLIFYGLGLVNASKYTFEDIKNLGLVQILLGLSGLYLIGYGILFWALGFGVAHVVYGAIMHYKYDRNRA